MPFSPVAGTTVTVWPCVTRVPEPLQRPCSPAAFVVVHMGEADVGRLVAALEDRLGALPAGADCSKEQADASAAYVQALGATSKALGFRFGPYVATSVPLLVERSAVDVDGDDAPEAAAQKCAAKEGSLLAITNIVQFCAEVRMFDDHGLSWKLQHCDCDAKNFPSEQGDRVCHARVKRTLGRVLADRLVAAATANTVSVAPKSFIA
jgi:hypothetical protein